VTKKKYYAIAKGRKPGVYDNWPEAQAQVRGFAGALFKGFPSRAEAEKWLKNPSYNRTRKYGKMPETAANDTLPEDGQVTIYTDGGSINNPGPGGYGIVQIYKEDRKELTGGFRHTTNNRMELTACIVALQHLEYRNVPVVLYSDSSYVVNGIQKGWAKKWRKNGWVKSDKKPAINPDLWGKLLDLVEGLDIEFRWVKGHAGNPLNERCDQLAVASARGNDLAIDEGYDG